MKKGRLWRFDINEVDEWMKNNELHQEQEHSYDTSG